MNNVGDHGSPIYKQNSKSRNFVTGYYVTILRLQLISLMYKNNKESLSRLIKEQKTVLILRLMLSKYITRANSQSCCKNLS